MRQTKGFTLIELLVVIALIGVLSTLLMANFNAARQRGRDAQRKSDVKTLQTALRLYYNDNGFYPDTLSVIDDPEYLNVMPTDPLPDQNYQYTREDLDTYVLSACLENKSDDKGVAGSGGWCPSDWVYEVRP